MGSVKIRRLRKGRKFGHYRFWRTLSRGRANHHSAWFIVEMWADKETIGVGKKVVEKTDNCGFDSRPSRFALEGLEGDFVASIVS